MDHEGAYAQAVPHTQPWRSRTWAAFAVLLVLLLAVLPAPAHAATGPHIVRADGDCLRMRTTPGLSGALISCLPDGSQVFALGETQDADGIRWERISAGGQTGWAAGIYLVAGTAISTPAPTPVPTAPPVAMTGTISGTVSSSGGVSLVVWTGGYVEALVNVAQGRGCGVRSVWVSRGGGLIGYIAGAPSFVNEAWNAQIGTGPLPELPVILLCSSGGSATPPATPSTPTPAPVPATPVATPTPPPPTGAGPGSMFPRNVPPGPAGNE